MTLRRVIVLAVTYLLCGFVVNVLVAWGSALRGAGASALNGYQYAETDTPYEVAWTKGSAYLCCVLSPDSPSYGGATPTMGNPAVTDVLPAWAKRYVDDIHPLGSAILATGWPSLSMSVLDDPAHFTPGGAGKRILPYRPIARGTIWNTLFYAMLIGVIHQAITGYRWPARVRTAIRKQRGLCPRCTYNLRGEMDRGCPECGWGR